MTELELETTREELKVMLADTILKLDKAALRPARLLNEEEAGDYLGVSKFTMRGWREAGKGPDWLKLGKDEKGRGTIIRYDVADLDKFAAAFPRRKEIQK